MLKWSQGWHVRAASRIAVLLLLGVWSGAGAASADADASLKLYYFWGEGCPVCDEQGAFLTDLSDRFPSLGVVSRELWRTQAHHAEFRRMAAAHGIEARSVPTIFIGGEAFIGDSPAVRSGIVATIERCLRESCPDSGDAAIEARPYPPASSRAIAFPLFGTIDLSLQPLIVSTAVIGFVDGFNPCSLWVLSVLLGLVVRSGSRRRVLLVGVTFLLTTAFVYGLFIAGVFGILAYVAHITLIQWLVGLLALIVGAVNVKDYLWFQRGLSFTISQDQKPGIYRRIRGLLTPGRSNASLVAATFLMALGIALVELPCTAGFPVIWSAIVADHAPRLTVFLALLALYLTLYLLVELALFLAVLRTLSIARFEERHGRILKLVGGMIMLALGLVLIFSPELMNRIDLTLLVFGAALLAAGVVMSLHHLLSRPGRAGPRSS